MLRHVKRYGPKVLLGISVTMFLFGSLLLYGMLFAQVSEQWQIVMALLGAVFGVQIIAIAILVDRIGRSLSSLQESLEDLNDTLS